MILHVILCDALFVCINTQSRLRINITNCRKEITNDNKCETSNIFQCESNSVGVTMTHSSTLVIDAIGVNPETKRHVRIAQKVNNSTTTNVVVLIRMT